MFPTKVRGGVWMSPQALGANKFALMPTNNSNFTNFVQLTFLFVKRLNVPDQREHFKNYTVPHGIYTFEVVWPVA